jgi:hypothetical protein
MYIKENLKLWQSEGTQIARRAEDSYSSFCFISPETTACLRGRHLSTFLPRGLTTDRVAQVSIGQLVIASSNYTVDSGGYRLLITKWARLELAVIIMTAS